MQAGDVLRGKYRLVRLLGDGGMGSVFEAHHEGLGTRVAIKVLHPELAQRPGLVERFLREARVSAQIKSPNVVQVVDVERTEDGTAYIVMELLEGEPLSAVLEREGKLDIGLASDFAGQILRALEAAHALGVVHRDLKPENVFITSTERPVAPSQPRSPLVKLIDFGIAKARQMDSQARNLTIAGIVMGTPEYMAPEQAHSADKVDARSDVFAVGVMLYEMICGSRPATGDDARLVALKVERGEVRPLVHAAPGVPPDLAGLVHRAMAPRPELRFGSASEMRAALEATTSKHAADLHAGPAGTTPPETARDAPRPSRWDHPQAGNGVPATDRPSAMPNPMSGRASAVSPPSAAGGGRAGARTDPTIAGVHYGSAPWPGPPAASPPGPHAPQGVGGVGPRGEQGVRGRPQRRPGSSMWLLFGVPVVVGVGIVVAFAASKASAPKPEPSSKPAPPPLVDVSPTPPSSAPAPASADTGTVPPLSPLNNPQAGTAPAHPGPAAPGSSARPHPSASASAAPSAPESNSPFPPFGFPTLPNPFPSPTSSGVGPVITIPTSFPFPFPGGPAPAPSSAPPAPSGKTI